MLADAPVQPKRGLFDSLRTLLTTAVAIASTRLEILATEYELEKRRLGRMLMLWTAKVVFPTPVSVPAMKRPGQLAAGRST